MAEDKFHTEPWCQHGYEFTGRELGTNVVEEIIGEDGIAHRTHLHEDVQRLNPDPIGFPEEDFLVKQCLDREVLEVRPSR